MKRILEFVGIVLAISFVLTSCEDGPSGVHPTTELTTVARRGAPFNDTLIFTYTAHGIMSGDSIPMRPFQFDQSTLNGISLSRMEGSATETVPDEERQEDADYLMFELPSIATGPTTFSEWEVGTIRIGGNGPSASMTSGPMIRINMVEYFGVSGSIVITNVLKDTSRVYAIEGYLSGTFKTIWPINFVSVGGSLPPGFDVANPTLVGNELTIHSVRFRMTSQSGVVYSGTNF